MNTSLGTRAFAAMVALSHAATILEFGESPLYEIAMRNAMHTATYGTQRWWGDD